MQSAKIQSLLNSSNGEVEEEVSFSLEARSANEFYAKMCIVVEEADETQFWLEILNESDIKVDKAIIQNHHAEWIEIVKIVTSAKAAARKKR